MLLYYLYFIITWCTNFIVPNLLYRRLRKGKESPKRFKEKLGIYSVMRPKGKIIWFHAASVGELRSIVPLVQLLEDGKEDVKWQVLITTVTLNASKIFIKAGFKNAIHQFAPVDSPQIVQKFLKHWQPSIGVFIDSELWPNLLAEASKKFKVINLNARLSDKSLKRWRYMWSLASYIYDRFSLILPCSSDDMRKISEFAKPDKLGFIGNLKLAASPMEANPEEVRRYKKLLGNKIIIVAASTHEKEEEIIVTAFANITGICRNAFLIIVPRNPSRGKEISHICKRLGFVTALHSKAPTLSKKDCIYVADSIGEMGLWYTISDIVIVGGSFIPHGGHNIIEPAKLNNAIITGVYTHNFRDSINHFTQNQAIITATSEELKDVIKKLVNDQAYRQSLAHKALKISNTPQVLDEARSLIIQMMYS